MPYHERIITRQPGHIASEGGVRVQRKGQTGMITRQLHEVVARRRVHTMGRTPECNASRVLRNARQRIWYGSELLVHRYAVLYVVTAPWIELGEPFRDSPAHRWVACAAAPYGTGSASRALGSGLLIAIYLSICAC